MNENSSENKKLGKNNAKNKNTLGFNKFINIPFFKIASGEIHTFDMIDYMAKSKKPILFITNNSLNNSVYFHNDNITYTAKLFEQKPLNIDSCLLENIKRNFKNNKKVYKSYFKNYIKFKGPNQLYPEIIMNRLKKDRVWV